MKPVLILQNQSGDGPAYLATWLRRAGVPLVVRDSEAGDAYPEHIDGHSALALLGGEMSANDELPSLRRAEALLLQAMRDGLPVIGHCLGGQLMARALGARVAVLPRPEIGWQPVRIADTSAARAWLGEPRTQPLMQWHYETFELPAGAERLASSDACANQAFAIGPHLAMQFHIEVDLDKLTRWAAEGGASHADDHRRHPQTVQSAAEMLACAAAQLPLHQALAARIYARWLDTVPR